MIRASRPYRLAWIEPNTSRAIFFCRSVSDGILSDAACRAVEHSARSPLEHLADSAMEHPAQSEDGRKAPITVGRPAAICGKASAAGLNGGLCLPEFILADPISAG